MATTLFVWMSPVADDRDSELNEWYNQIHVPQMREIVPEIDVVRRYRILRSDGAEKQHRYLTTYDIKTDDIDGILAAIGEASSSGAMVMTDAIDLADLPPKMIWYLRISDREESSM